MAPGDPAHRDLDPDLARIRAFVRKLEELTSTRIEPFRFGTVLRNDEFPLRGNSNFLRVERSVGEVAAAELAAETDRRLRDAPHRGLVVEDESEGTRLAAGFGELGWEVDRFLYMVRRRPPDRQADAYISEISLEGSRPLALQFNRGAPGGLKPAIAEMLTDFRHVLVEHANARFFVGDVGGVLAGYCELYSREGVAQIEHVNTLEGYRGRGLARGLVGRATREAATAGNDLVFLDADDRDWPKQLYRRLGFDPVGRFWRFTRYPPDETAPS